MSKRKIILDVSRLLYRLTHKKTLTGIDRVSISYIKKYASESRAFIYVNNRPILFNEYRSCQLFSSILSCSFKKTSIYISILDRIKFLSLKPLNNSILINTSHANLDSGSYWKDMHKLKLKSIIFVHDLLPITHPEHFTAKTSEIHAKSIINTINHASGIICNSKATFTQLLKYAEDKRKKMPKVETALLGSSLDFSKKKANHLSVFSYFVMLGTIESRKNHFFILKIWRKIVEKYGNEAPKLVIIGKRGWKNEYAVDMLAQCNLIKEHIQEINSCKDEELINYLYGAKALLFPSFCEGFGLPLAEALSIGTPVIASNLPVFNEIAGDVPDYIDPLDGKKWEEVIMEYTSNYSLLHKKQRERMINLKLQTLEDHFKIVDNFIEQISNIT